MPFHLGDAFDWAQAIIERTNAERQAETCAWCGLPLVTPDEKAWELCSYCRIGDGEPDQSERSHES